MSFRSGGVIRNIIAASSAPYVGPGDVVPGATAWWGLRAYNAATAGAKAINLRASGDNATSDFNTLTNGNLDVASISTFLTAHGGSLFVTKLYDQTGNGNDQVQATAANQPSFTLNGLGTLPTIGFVNANSLSLATAGSITATDGSTTFSAVANHTASAIQECIFFVGGTFQLGYRNSANNQAFLYAGVVLSATASDGNWHAIQAVFNAASSDLNIDGASNIGNDGAPGPVSGNVFLGSVSGSQFLDGSMTEGGVWPVLFSSGQETSMSANQHGYWGF